MESGELSADQDIDSILARATEGEMQEVPDGGKEAVSFENLVYTESSDSGDYLAKLRVGRDGSVFVSLDISAHHESNICDGYYIGPGGKVTFTRSLDDYDVDINTGEMDKYSGDASYEPFAWIVSQLRMDVLK